MTGMAQGRTGPRGNYGRAGEGELISTSAGPHGRRIKVLSSCVVFDYLRRLKSRLISEEQSFFPSFFLKQETKWFLFYVSTPG